MLKNKQIAALCREAEDFVAEKLCPMLEEMAGETGGDEFRKNLFATMMTVGTEISTGDLKIVKKGEEFVIVKRGADDGEAEEEKESEEEAEKEPKSEKDKVNAMGDEISSLIAKIIRCAKKYADDKDDYAKILASTAATIAEVGGKKAKHITMLHLNTDIEDVLKAIVNAI